MKKPSRSAGLLAVLVCAACVLFAGPGCVSDQTWRDIADSSTATVASTILDLTVIDALECALTRECT